jgi:hypothetical protein
MDTLTKRDNRSYEMKKLLQKQYPTARFTVKIHKYSMGESIYVKTDLIKAWTQEDSDNDWKKRTRAMGDQPFIITDSIKATEAKSEANEKIRHEIEALLKNFWHIAYDSYSGEILSGGNSYINIGELREV